MRLDSGYGFYNVVDESDYLKYIKEDYPGWYNSPDGGFSAGGKGNTTATELLELVRESFIAQTTDRYTDGTNG